MLLLICIGLGHAIPLQALQCAGAKIEGQPGVQCYVVGVSIER